MPKPTFEQIERLFHDALALPAAQRQEFLKATCNGNADLQAAVEKLLRNVSAQPRTETFLVSPVAAAASQLRANAPTVYAGRATNGTSATPTPIPGYELLEELGRGGMGVVYKVRQLNLDRIVALKMLLPGELVAPEMLARFRTEVETLARLHHPNIVAIYDIGEHERRPYFTMEYIPGPSLDRLLLGKAQDVIASVTLIETLARTMHAVHEQGIIHRDLKPANVLLQQTGAPTEEAFAKTNGPSSPDSSLLTAHSFTPKITDFGLAKDQAAVGKLTQTGITMGTPSYMAPEQAQGRGADVGPATDIYALGSILYEMLTGRPPFVGESPADIVTQLLNDEPLLPSRLRPKLPRDLATICLKCLEKVPRRRYASALDLAEDLRRFRTGEPIRARAVGWFGRTWRWCRRRPLVAGLGLLSALLLAILVVTVLVYDHRLREALARAEVKMDTQRRQIIHLNVHIGTSATDVGDTLTALVRFTEALRLAEGFTDDEWKHRTRIAALLRQNPHMVPADKTDHAADKDRLPSEHIGAVSSAEELKLTNGVTIKVTRAWTAASLTPPTSAEKTVTAAAFSPDGRYVVTRGADGSARVWNTATGDPITPRLSCGSPILYAAFSPDGTRLVTLCGDHARVWDPVTGEPLTPPMPYTLPPRRAFFSADGHRVIILHESGAVSIWDLTPDTRPVADLVKVARDMRK